MLAKDKQGELPLNKKRYMMYSNISVGSPQTINYIALMSPHQRVLFSAQEFHSGYINSSNL